MPETEQEQHEITGSNEGVPFSQFSIPVEGLLPEVRKKNELERPDNLPQILPDLIKEVESRQWFQEFLHEVKTGKKKAIFELVVGGIVITAGLYEGRDLKALVRMIDHYKKRSKTHGER